ncbi:hypothetical protein A4G99_20790 [Haladaptatus sp. R4]|uniref:hypothetical protein n=1 Tax=Haladaptatus sp. R4 TaxID=1679489 RepID=UPI0007B4B1AE|nr:hypothetical protein [Haladaptatus sp. R4]KZN26486.1 hypothetical protein A4G99_20790 [Haladaptatus sp. R4]
MIEDGVVFELEAPPLTELPSPRTKLVYLYLFVVGRATVETIHDALGIGYLELYSSLRILRERDLVRNGRNGFSPRNRADFDSGSIGEQLP